MEAVDMEAGKKHVFYLLDSSHDQHKWSHSVMLVTLGHEDQVESCEAQAHDCGQGDLYSNGEVQSISKGKGPKT